MGYFAVVAEETCAVPADERGAAGEDGRDHQPGVLPVPGA